MRPIDADALIEFCAERWIPLNIDAVNMQPTIQPEKAQLFSEDTTSDLISRQQALDAVGKYASVWMEYTDAMSKDEIAQIALNNAKSTMIRILKELPPAQPEPSILLSWVEKYIEWLKSFDNEFANLAAAHISVMVKKWRDEKK